MEAVQQCILSLLESQSIIQDTRNVKLPGESKAATNQDGQLLIQGALNSLLSKEVCIPLDLNDIQ